MRDLYHKPKNTFFSGVADAMEGGLCIQDTIASRYIHEFLIITYVSTLLCSGRVLCVLFVIQSAPKFD